MVLIRWLVGSLILLLDWAFTPRGVMRDRALQSSIDAQTSKLTLYHYKACPFCVKVRRAMKRHSLKIETRDAKRCATSREELLTGGGALKVPCLRIEDASGAQHWMYESKDIVAYLEQRFTAG